MSIQWEAMLENAGKWDFEQLLVLTDLEVLQE